MSDTTETTATGAAAPAPAPLLQMLQLTGLPGLPETDGDAAPVCGPDGCAVVVRDQQ
ncbi:hypothetical protein [Streptacidiphilus neutrinimicus]|uniref:hypothetical protein n=1 Tax=Streptacidiphilus neutrinimicus TaxID=105420 RepID=UPI000B2A4C59|nr:hypothetical protein [Streptacidiphilus neutrinimicus]